MHALLLCLFLVCLLCDATELSADAADAQVCEEFGPKIWQPNCVRYYGVANCIPVRTRKCRSWNTEEESWCEQYRCPTTTTTTTTTAPTAPLTTTTTITTTTTGTTTTNTTTTTRTTTTKTTTAASMMSTVNCTTVWCREEDTGYNEACPIYNAACDVCKLNTCDFQPELSYSCWEWVCYPFPTTTTTTTVAPTTGTPSAAAGLQLGAEVVGGIAAVVLLTLAVLLAFLKLRKRTQQDPEQQQQQQQQACASCLGWLDNCRGRCMSLPLVAFNSLAEEEEEEDHDANSPGSVASSEAPPSRDRSPTPQPGLLEPPLPTATPPSSPSSNVDSNEDIPL